MYKRLMAPVDLGHPEGLRKALDIAADLAKHYGADLCYVGVTTEAPSEIARTPAEFAEKLAAFASDEGAKHGIAAASKAIAGHDPAVDLERTLLRAAKDMGADLIVMASHVAGPREWLWHSHGGKVAADAAVSVMLVR